MNKGRRGRNSFRLPRPLPESPVIRKSLVQERCSSPNAACVQAQPAWNPSVTFGDSSPFRRACNKASMPPLKEEVPAVRAVGFKQSPQPLECMAVGGAFCPATASGTGPCPAQALAASIYGGQWSSRGCAAATGRRPCRPGKPKNSGTPIYGPRIRQ